MPVVILHHRVQPDFCGHHEAFDIRELEAVAVVDCTRTDFPGVLNEAWEKGNTVEAPWWKNFRVSLLADGKQKIEEKGGMRSLSVGDAVEFRGFFYLVQAFGFVELEAKDREKPYWFSPV